MFGNTISKANKTIQMDVNYCLEKNLTKENVTIFVDCFNSHRNYGKLSIQCSCNS